MGMNKYSLALLCSYNICKDVFNPNGRIFQSNCAEGLHMHFTAFHSILPILPISDHALYYSCVDYSV